VAGRMTQKVPCVTRLAGHNFTGHCSAVPSPQHISPPALSDTEHIRACQGGQEHCTGGVPCHQGRWEKAGLLPAWHATGLSSKSTGKPATTRAAAAAHALQGSTCFGPANHLGQGWVLPEALLLGLQAVTSADAEGRAVHISMDHVVEACGGTMCQ
jgi:hypothetical protein